MNLLNVSLDEMFPRAEAVTRPPLPQLKNTTIYKRIKRNATALRIELTPEHMEVINFILDFYEHCDDCQNARTLADLMQAEFAREGGRKYLYQLFPDGPLSTIHDLVELPDLNHQHDKSFGTRW